MPFDPAYLLDVARLLISPAHKVEEQSRFRTALNRAYYAPLLVLIQRIEGVQGPGTVPLDGTHAKLRNALKDTGMQHLAKIKHKLESLGFDRNEADYNLHAPAFVQIRVEDNIAKADSLIRDIRHHLPDEKVRRISF